MKTLHPTAWNGIIKWAPEPEWAKLTGVFTLNHKSRFDPINPEKKKFISSKTSGLNILTRELGPVGLIKFLKQYKSGVGDYSKTRHQWLDKFSIDDIQELILSKRQKTK